MKRVIVTISILAFSIIFIKSIVFAACDSSSCYADAPINCPVVFNTVTCNGGSYGANGRFCGVVNNGTQCADYNSIPAPSSIQYSSSIKSSNNILSGLTTGGSTISYTTGGNILNCSSSAAGNSPWCRNGNVCAPSQACYNLNRRTACSANLWYTATCDLSDTTGCFTNYLNCDTSDNSCEILVGSSCGAIPANSSYVNSCAATPGPGIGGNCQCNTDAYACGSNTPLVGGCDIVSNVTLCDAGSGAGSGRYQCSSGTGPLTCTKNGTDYTYKCTCVGDPVHFITDTEAKYASTNALLWGTEYGTGNILDLGFFDGSVRKQYFGILNNGLANFTSLALTSDEEKDLSGMLGGSFYYNATNKEYRYYDGTNWKPFGNILSGGSTGDTLRYNGDNWVASNLLYNTGTQIGINLGTNSPGAGTNLDVGGVINVSTGFRIANAAVAGQYLRGNDTDFVSSAILFGDLPLAAGTGISFSDNGTTMTITNTDLGSSQNIFKTIAAGTTNFAASSNSDTLTFEGTGGTTVTLDADNKKVVINSSSAKYVGLSDSSYNGVITNGTGNTGYVAANNICNLKYKTSAHMCTTEEIMNTIRAHSDGSSILEFPISGDAWISEGPPGYTTNSNDCVGYTNSSNTGGYYGAVWSFNRTNGGFGLLTNCSNTTKIACCL